ncbi:efflux RND transporter permease subunit [Neolewinella aurantiaca]|uniref:Efflux RND transporter permease subunit n=1 Tax=Neolewinella aurantiaca TaxID=2602767 RepID=A0A5C7FJW3_9BACT|nr:efflux RND transporter permease subunit [Neolewinella aurantiaca]
MAAIVLGLLAAGQLPVSLLPEVGIPRVSVQVSYPNAAARTVEDAVVAPLRNTLLQVNNLSGIRSRAREEAAVLYLDFPFGTDPDLAFIEVNEKIDQAMNQLPREVERPRVLATDVSDIPVVQLSVTLSNPTPGPSPRGRGGEADVGSVAPEPSPLSPGEGPGERERAQRASPPPTPASRLPTPDSRLQTPTSDLLPLSNLAENVLRRRLEQLDEVAFADLSGQATPRIVVRPKQAALRALGKTEADLANLLRAANVELGGLLLADGHYEYAVRFTGSLRTAEDLENLYLRVGAPATPELPGGERTVPLSDLATVTYEAEPARGLFLHNGAPGVIFTIRKRADARLFELRENLQTLVADLEAEYPDLRFRLNNDQTAVLRASIDNLSGGLLYGAGFAILVLFAFFREWRRPLLIGLAVPIALLIAVLGFYLAGLSVNVISLAGLILGLGLMIDNSIIVLDNIASYRELSRNSDTSDVSPLPRRGAGGEGNVHTTAAATNEVIRPLISSALTTIAVFLPLVLLSGIAGALFRDQAIAVTLALAASLLVAYFLLPMLSVLMSRSNASNVSLDSVGTGGEATSGASIPTSNVSNKRSTTHYKLPTTFYLLFLLPWLALGYLALSTLPTQGFPELSRSDYQLNIDWAEALPLNVHRTRVSALMADWQANFGGENSALIGENQFLLAEENQATNASELQFFLPAPPAADFAGEWLAQQRKEYPVATFTMRPVSNLFDRIFLNDEPYVELRLRAAGDRETPGWNSVQPLLERMREEGFNPAPPARNEAVSLQIDYMALATARVSSARLRDRILTLFSENEVTSLRANDRALPVLLAGTDDLSADRLLAATVTNQDGNEIPLRQLLKISKHPDYRVLTADRAGEYLGLVFSGEPTTDDITRIENIAGEFPEFTSQLAGRFLTDQSRVGELGGVLLVSLLLLYLILAAQFEGVKLPLVVLLVVPISLVGSLLALWFTGGSLNLLSLIGMVVTGGIVVNDAIIKVDMIERGRAAGMSMPAAIKEASRRRLRAIVMTSLTTILALAPVLFTSGLGAELQQPLAVTVIGGLLVGTVGSLYVVPLLYRLFSGADAGAMKG